MTYDLGFASILSTTSYFDNHSSYGRDFTANDIGDISGISGIGLPANTGAGLLYIFPNKLFTQEFRLASSGDGPFKWLVGGYYSSFNPVTGQREVTTSSLTRDLDIYTTTAHNSRKEYAAFGQASYSVTNRLELVAGLRVFEYKISSHSVTSGIFATGDLSGAVSTSSLASKDSSKALKVAANYKLTENNIIFAQASQGYRVGGATGSFPSSCTADLKALGYDTAPDSYKPDKLWDYEIGSKNSFLDHHATLNATAYYIDWNRIQLAQNLTTCGYQFISNAGKAKSRGVELEGSITPFGGLDLHASTAWTKATFDDTNTQLRTIAGGDLPNVPRWTASGSAQYTVSVGSGEDIYFRADAQYVGSRLNELIGNTRALVRQPGYTLLNARVGFERGPYEIALFATNITDERAVLNTALTGSPFETIATPRTIGINVKAHF